ncbi:MAG: hypothetical protein JWO06_172 [Bacteroidota bacterium]|nr:hypothetical protein [Bacteroidota bacterium]
MKTKKTAKKDIEKKQQESEIDKAWSELYEIADGCIVRYEGVMNRADFIEEGKRIFDLKFKAPNKEL